MVNYKEGKIYIIRSPHTPLVYVGSTCKKLSTRFCGHKKGTCSSRRVIDFGNAYIELLELYPCDSKVELISREFFHINSTPNTVNFIRNSHLEYYEKSCEKYRNELMALEDHHIISQNHRNVLNAIDHVNYHLNSNTNNINMPTIQPSDEETNIELVNDEIKIKSDTTTTVDLIHERKERKTRKKFNKEKERQEQIKTAQEKLRVENEERAKIREEKLRVKEEERFEKEKIVRQERIQKEEILSRERFEREKIVLQERMQKEEILSQEKIVRQEHIQRKSQEKIKTQNNLTEILNYRNFFKHIVIIKNEKLSTFKNSEKMPKFNKGKYIYIINNFIGDICHADIENTFKIGKTAQSNPLDRIKQYRYYGDKFKDVNIAILFYYPDAHDDNELNFIERTFKEFCNNTFAKPNFPTTSAAPEFFHGDVEILINFIENYSKIISSEKNSVPEQNNIVVETDFVDEKDAFPEHIPFCSDTEKIISQNQNYDDDIDENDTVDYYLEDSDEDSDEDIDGFLKRTDTLIENQKKQLGEEKRKKRNQKRKMKRKMKKMNKKNL